MSSATSTARRSMAGAKARDAKCQAAFEAGVNGVAWDEHRDHREGEDPNAKACYDEGVAEARRTRRGELGQRASRVGRQSAGYVGRVGRSVRDRSSEIPTSSGGSWVGVFVGVLAVIALFLLLTKSTLAATTVTGFTKGIVWLVSPSTLPI